LHLTSKGIVSASSGRSEASSVFPSLAVSGGSGPVSGSHFRSTGVGLGGGMQWKPSGKVRQRWKSPTRRSEDERREQQGGAAGSRSTARRRSVTTKTDRRSVDFVFDSESTNHQHVGGNNKLNERNFLLLVFDINKALSRLGVARRIYKSGHAHTDKEHDTSTCVATHRNN